MTKQYKSIKFTNFNLTNIFCQFIQLQVYVQGAAIKLCILNYFLKSLKMFVLYNIIKSDMNFVL